MDYRKMIEVIPYLCDMDDILDISMILVDQRLEVTLSPGARYDVAVREKYRLITLTIQPGEVERLHGNGITDDIHTSIALSY